MNQQQPDTLEVMITAQSYNGIEYWARGEYEKAIEVLNESIRLRPDLASNFYCRGKSYAGLGQHLAAIKDYTEAIRIRPDDGAGSFYHDRGSSFARLGEHLKAIKDYNAAILMRPERATTYHNRGLSYRHLGAYDKAILDFNEAIRLRPDHAATHNNRGVSFSYLGAYDEAIQDFNEAIRLRPDHAGTFNNRGMAFRAKAIEDFNEAIRLRPDYADTFNNLEMTFSASYIESDAIEDLTSAEIVQESKLHEAENAKQSFPAGKEAGNLEYSTRNQNPRAALNELLEKTAHLIHDYRSGDILPRSPQIIEHWLDQFPTKDPLALLTAFFQVLEKSYITKEQVRKFWTKIATAPPSELTGGRRPVDFWGQAAFFNHVGKGKSQDQMVTVFSQILQEEYNIDPHTIGLDDDPGDCQDFIYLDDAIYTGFQVKKDLSEWLRRGSPNRVNIHVIAPVIFTDSYWVGNSSHEYSIQQYARDKDIGKVADCRIWANLSLWRLESRRSYAHTSDKLWPASLPQNPYVGKYQSLLDQALEDGRLQGEKPWAPRPQQPPDTSRLFPDSGNRTLLEDQLLIRSCQIALDNSIPVATLRHGWPRPLGFGWGFGFGSLVVTYRNCPNNNPLALWWGSDADDFPPLFPRVG